MMMKKIIMTKISRTEVMMITIKTTAIKIEGGIED